MTIENDKNPEGTAGFIKFLVGEKLGDETRSMEGHRGVLIALHKSGKLAIILGATAYTWGKLYLTEETVEGEWSKAQKLVHGVPNNKQWRMVVGFDREGATA